MRPALDSIQNLITIPEVVGLTQIFLGLVLLLLVIILVGHVVAGIGRRSFLYKKRPPVPGWNRHFYPALVLLFIVVGGLFVLLQFYRRQLM